LEEYIVDVFNLGKFSLLIEGVFSPIAFDFYLSCTS